MKQANDVYEKKITEKYIYLVLYIFSMSENDKIQANLDNTINDFSSADQVNTNNTSFLNSNGLIAKVVFLIMVVIVFIVLFYVITKMIGYFLSPSLNPLLINGQIEGTNSVVISQNPADSSAIQVLRSNNQTSGIEFTWSVWLNYAGSPNSYYNPVFVKGDCSITKTSEYCSVNNCPGVYWGKKDDLSSNTIYIVIDTILPQTDVNNNIDSVTQSNIIKIPNLPVGNYFHLAIRCRNSYIDVYVNGTVVNTTNIMNIPKQNYYDVNVCPNGGFSGKLSNLQYFSKSLNVVELNTIVKKGPNLTPANVSGSSSKNTSNVSISTSWYNSFFR